MAPERYRVPFTVGQEPSERLRRLQALLRREIPDGDPGWIYDRALKLMVEKVAKKSSGHEETAAATAYPSRDG